MVYFCFFLILVEFVQHFEIRFTVFCGDKVQALDRQLPKVITSIVKPANGTKMHVHKGSPFKRVNFDQQPFNKAERKLKHNERNMLI